MRTFRDNADRQWNLSLTVGAIKRVKEKLGVDLLRLDEPVKGDEQPQELLGARLECDMSLICDVLFVLVQPQASLLNPPLTDVAFGETLGAEGFAAGKAAMTQELIDFFQKAGRPELAKMLAAHAELAQLTWNTISTRIEEIDLAALSRTTLGAHSTNSPSSPESKTSIPAPCGNSYGAPTTPSASAGTTPPTS